MKQNATIIACQRFLRTIMLQEIIQLPNAALPLSARNHAVPLPGKLNFDPASGQTSTSATPQTSLTAAQLGILFAIACGNMTVVAQVSPARFKD